ncbi:MAG: diacylglycerol kinase family lipid kinase [Acholeplasmataceae bacterium]|nr:diacylglycerol kinase family lipid kinase [Acholeplasmataceae bacterium]
MRFLLLYNPVSGRSRFTKHLDYIINRFKTAGLHLDIYESKFSKDLQNQAFLNATNYDVFLIGGGDGTVNEVINGVMNSKGRPKIGILPSGTANDIAAILGIPRNIKKALEVYFNQQPVNMDINKMNDQYFIYTAAAGILTRVSYDVSRRRLLKYGYLAYVFAGMRDLMHDYRFPLEITYNGKTISGEYMLALGLSSNRVGGMQLANFAKSKLNDGLFELRLFERRRYFRRFRLLSFFLRRGKCLREEEHLISNRFVIKTNPDVSWNADGELATHGDIVIEVLKEKIEVYTSNKVKSKFF